MNKRDANTLMALIVALIATQIVCTAHILHGQDRIRKQVETARSHALYAVDFEARTAAKSESAALQAARQQLADISRQIADQQSEILQTRERLETDKAELDAKLLEEQLRQRIINETNTAMNKALAEQNTLAEQNERRSGTFLIPLAR